MCKKDDFHKNSELVRLKQFGFNASEVLSLHIGLYEGCNHVILIQYFRQYNLRPYGQFRRRKRSRSVELAGKTK